MLTTEELIDLLRAYPGHIVLIDDLEFGLVKAKSVQPTEVYPYKFHANVVTPDPRDGVPFSVPIPAVVISLSNPRVQKESAGSS